MSVLLDRDQIQRLFDGLLARERAARLKGTREPRLAQRRASGGGGPVPIRLIPARPGNPQRFPRCGGRAEQPRRHLRVPIHGFQDGEPFQCPGNAFFVLVISVDSQCFPVELPRSNGLSQMKERAAQHIADKGELLPSEFKALRIHGIGLFVRPPLVEDVAKFNQRVRQMAEGALFPAGRRALCENGLGAVQVPLLSGQQPQMAESQRGFVFIPQPPPDPQASL